MRASRTNTLRELRRRSKTINEILQAAGFVENVTYTQTVFVKPPQRTFVVYVDDVDADGSDYTTDIFTHSVRLELYSPNRADPAAEKRLEATFRQYGIHYRKLGRTWLESERYFLTTYYFDFTEKEI